jgi:ComF family protein
MHPLRHLQGVRVAAYYENSPIEPAIHALKYYNHKAIAAILGQTLSEAYQRYQLRADVVAPVPLHPARYHERGYNQSELLAQELTLRLNISLDTTSLQRHKRTSSQVKLSAAERQQNVAGAFSCRGQAFAGQQVLLVDDVYTTGATMDACAAVLLQAGGAAAVWGLALARPVL